MSLVQEIDTNFWSNPPWGKGEKKYRLGLKPIEKSSWFDSKISEKLHSFKIKSFNHRYSDVIAVTEDSIEAQQLLAQKITPASTAFPDLIANISLAVPDDICIIKSSGDQELLAGSVCSPSYWNLKEKIGLPLRKIHSPVKSLNSKIGNPIERFIKNMPEDIPFKRENWFIHEDENRFHNKSESFLSTDISSCYIRSERETILKFSPDYAVFSINVRFKSMKSLIKYREVSEALLKSLDRMDNDEIQYFGGSGKVKRIQRFLSS